ncbi:MAG: gas vesicle protein K [bacterium]
MEQDLQHGLAEALSDKIGSPRINLDPEKVEQGLVKLVLTLVEFIRQLLERQSIRKIEAGSLDDGEIERLGTTLMKLEEKVKELQEYFEIDDLNINLGPLGDLIEQEENYGTRAGSCV